MEPLSREQISALHKELQDNLPDMWSSGECTTPFYVEFARWIERAHGIGEQHDQKENSRV